MSTEGLGGAREQDRLAPAGSRWLKYTSNGVWISPELFLSVLLVIVTLAAYANAWPDTLVLDDKFFAGSERFGGVQDFPRLFTENVWAAAGVRSNLYRPLLVISLSLDSYVYGDWMAGYHLSNILLHLLVTLCVFGFIRQLLLMANGEPTSAGRYAFLAALVFAVHPVHTEVVNSIFNRSEALVSLGAVAGLWWFMHHLQSRPVKAWSGLAVAYLLAMFCKESAVVLPGVAVVLVWIFTPGGWLGRVRKCLPVLWLLIPLAFYLALRVGALAPIGEAQAAGPDGVAKIGALFHTSRRSGLYNLLRAAGVWGQALAVMVWPYPLKLFYLRPPLLWQWAALVLHVVLITAALFEYRRKRFGLIAGLAFFYIAILPSSGFAGLLGYVSPLSERYLYLPSVGLAIALAFGLRFLGHRFGARVALAPVLLAVLVLTPLCWARNAEWGSEVSLFESEYRNGGRTNDVLYAVTSARIRERDFAGAIEICDRHANRQKASGLLSSNCALAYSTAGRNEEAERAYILATHRQPGHIRAHNNLATFYLRLGRRDDAKKHLELAIEAEKDPALREYRKGKMLTLLYRSDRGKLQEAREHFREALRLQPHLIPAQQEVERLNRVLGSP